VGSNPASVHKFCLLKLSCVVKYRLYETGRSLFQRRPTCCSVSKCDLESSTARRSRTPLGCCATKRNYSNVQVSNMLPVFRGMVTEPENKKKVQVYCIVVCMSEERKDFLCACCNIKKHVDNESSGQGNTLDADKKRPETGRPSHVPLRPCLPPSAHRPRQNKDQYCTQAMNCNQTDI